jgi:hypothetical protein
MRAMGLGRWLIVFAFAFTLHAPAWSQIYKWVDEAGVTHYGSAPPAGASATLVQPAAPVVPAASTAGAKQARRAPGDDMRTVEEDASERARDQPDPMGRKSAEADRLLRCAFSRQQLDVVTLGGPVFRRDAQGGRHYLPDEARGGEIARLRADVAQQCAGLDSDAATQVRWRQINNFVVCDSARSLLQSFDANRSRVSNQEYDKVTRLVKESCSPNRFPPETGRRGEWFRQYVLPGELRQ